MFGGRTADEYALKSDLENIDTEVSWNDLTDKPFGETTTVKEVLTWDGVVLDDDPSGEVYGTLITYHRVSDDVPSVEQLSAGGIYTLCQNSEFMDTEFTSSDVQDNTSVGFIVVGPVIIACTDNVTAQGLTFPKAGIYFMSMPEEYASGFKVNGYQFETKTVKKISGKYVEGMGYVEESAVVFYDGEYEIVHYEDYDETCGEALWVYDRDTVPGYGSSAPIIVEFDGVSYKFNIEWGMNGSGTFYAEGSDSAPFWVMFYGASNMFSITLWADAPGIHNVRAYIQSETIHPIDPKFLPSGGSNGIFFVKVVGTYDVSKGTRTYECDKLASEIAEAYNNGSYVLCWLDEAINDYQRTNVMCSPTGYDSEYGEFKFAGLDLEYSSHNAYCISIGENYEPYVNAYPCGLPYEIFGSNDYRHLVWRKSGSTGIWEMTDNVVIRSASGKYFKLTVDDNGTLSAAAV